MKWSFISDRFDREAAPLFSNYVFLLKKSLI